MSEKTIKEKNRKECLEVLKIVKDNFKGIKFNDIFENPENHSVKLRALLDNCTANKLQDYINKNTEIDVFRFFESIDCYYDTNSHLI